MQVVKGIEVLFNPTIKEIFKLIVDARFLSRYEIKSKEPVSNGELENVLGQLEQAGLIEKKSGSIDAFDTFYPTGSGLTAEKMVNE